MVEKKHDEPYSHHPGQHAGATTAQTQAGEDLADVPPPEDLRDEYGNAGPAVGDAVPAGVIDVREAPGGPYPAPNVVERPHTAQTPETFSGEPTRDPSFSRAVDRAAAGLATDSAGYDRSMEGPPPGPLDPDVEEQPADAESEPGGQWGSSG
ncbi:MAG TPA: hypothetical protein VMP67_05665 [Candidatus Limnocylindria bacterium]|nr:hypothetical protein [Candidatus Limnocylindria bacterium]